MTYDPQQPQQPYDPYTAPPVFDSQPVTGGSYSGYPDQQQYPQYEQYSQYPQQQYAEPQYSPQQPYVQPVYTQQYVAPAVAPMVPQNGAGTAALVLGIISIVGCTATSIPAIICGIIGLGRAKRGEATNQGAALGGIICGSISLLLVGGFVLFAFVLAANEPTY